MISDRITFVTICVSLTVSLIAGQNVTTSYGQQEITIPTSTVVPVRTTEQLSSEQLEQGTAVNSIVVARDIQVDGVTVIEAGAPVIAQVAGADDAGRVGQGGELEVNIQAVTAVDGSSIGVSGTMSRKGEGQVGQSVGIAAILCPLALLMKGEEGAIPSDAETRTLTSGEHTVEISE